MPRNNFDDWLKSLSVQDRIALAKKKADRMTNHLINLIAIHEANKVAVFSDLLSKQIKPSIAAHAFNLFADSSIHHELIGLCAIWDKPDKNAENIQTISCLVDNLEVLEQLWKETYEGRANMGVRTFDDELDVEAREEASEALREYLEKTARSTADDARAELENAIIVVNAKSSSRELEQARNFRDKNLAHLLELTRAEDKLGKPINPPKIKETHSLVDDAIRIATAFNTFIRGVSFNFENSRRIEQERAKALWEGCTFNILR